MWLRLPPGVSWEAIVPGAKKLWPKLSYPERILLLADAERALEKQRMDHINTWLDEHRPLPLEQWIRSIEE